MSSQLSVPDILRESIASLQQQIIDCCDDSLAALIAYGSAVTGRFRPRFSDINLMLVLESCPPSVLENLHRHILAARETTPVQPMVLLESDLARAAEAFPIKFLDITHAYCVLHGRDVLAGVEIPRERIEWRCRQEALNTSWRLRRALVVRREDLDVDRVVAQFFPSAFAVMRGLVFARSGEWIISREAVLARAADLFELPQAPLERFIAWKKEQLDIPADQWSEAVHDFAAAIQALVEAAHGQ